MSDMLVLAETRVQAAKRDAATLQSVNDGSISHDNEPALSSTFAYDMVEDAGASPTSLALDRIQARMKTWAKVCTDAIIPKHKKRAHACTFIRFEHEHIRTCDGDRAIQKRDQLCLPLYIIICNPFR
jgi:hypothetical protein